VLERSDAFVAGVAQLDLEGVVAKRLDSRYTPGRRSSAWIKHKLRRDERLAVTGIRRSPDGTTEAVFVARQLPDGSLQSAGSIEHGLRPHLIERLERILAELPARRRGAVAWYPAEVSVLASVHGLPDGPVRDAVLREIVHSSIAQRSPADRQVIASRAVTGLCTIARSREPRGARP
jgi:ATP-dependent DNA ligase